MRPYPHPQKGRIEGHPQTPGSRMLHHPAARPPSKEGDSSDFELGDTPLLRRVYDQTLGIRLKRTAPLHAPSVQPEGSEACP
jgi:hypothetical protein